jgi:hypothetical protein
LYCRISELQRLSVEKTKLTDRIITERDALQSRLNAAEVRLAEMVFVYTPEDVTAEQIELLNEQQAIAGEDEPTESQT